ncbi:hypothetical protein LTS07_004274 [Exophiala sideris]|uniref:Uncharacterized protein n=1 Tax=Exophiala sideris TaxID=1016849 RepID=A0ABR0JF85_9EURO|nr:hypothetical protein LTS07_004274 [Exophiala sideris]KAK5062388.1 hypothetical protein LTR69_004746 [Exophiala sideris]KAK5177546.1 hypothetical protein LTR44_009956 [Eurotiomycetes sp. CCFEE 6388]
MDSSVAPSTPKKLLRSGGSLRSLRSKLSSLSLRGRRASAQKRLVVREESPLARRGRSFRPLSIVNTAMQPFDFDVARAMQVVQGQMAETTTTASEVNLPAILSDDDSKTITPGTQTPAMSSPASQTSLQASMEDRADRQDSVDEVITADFNSLTLQPPPDISQHPAFAADPETSTSNAPLMITTSSAAEIRKWAQEKRKNEAERNTKVRFNETLPRVGGRNAFVASTNNLPSMDNPFNARPAPPEAAMTGTPYRSFHAPAFSGFRHREGWISTDTVTPYSMRTNPSRLHVNTKNITDAEAYEALGAGSPPGPRPLLIPPKTPVDSSKSASTPISDGFDSKKSGMRKVADLFKPKSDKAQDTSPILRTPDGGPPRTFQRPDLERYLRTTLNVRTYDYSPEQPYPRHPNTGRAWHSRNLHCTNCLDKCCAVCGRACCAYQAAYFATKIHKDNPESLFRAQETLGNIANVFAHGQEVPTFLQCTHGAPGDKLGCGKMCRKCKKNMWEECIWHDKDMNRLAI